MPEKELTIRRRLTELCLATANFAAAQTEAEALAKLERKKSSACKPEEWQAPGLTALALYGQFCAGSPTVSREALDKAFQQVLEPGENEPRVHLDPRVYLARYEYRLQQHVPEASDDLDAALILRRRISASSSKPPGGPIVQP